MPWGVILLTLFTSLAIAIFVSWPLLMGKGEVEAAAEEGPIDQLLGQKDTIYSAIKELEFDHAMGNLSDGDYRELSRRYEDRAVALLQSIDEVSTVDEDRVEVETGARGGVMGGKSRSISPGDAIEEEIAALRARRRAKTGSTVGDSLDEEIEAQVAATKAARQREGAPRNSTPSRAGSPSSAVACPSCAAPVKNPGAAYCSRCGAALSTKCPGCGAAVEAGDLFCSECGSSLSARGNEPGVTVAGGSHA